MGEFHGRSISRSEGMIVNWILVLSDFILSHRLRKKKQDIISDSPNPVLQSNLIYVLLQTPSLPCASPSLFSPITPEVYSLLISYLETFFLKNNDLSLFKVVVDEILENEVPENSNEVLEEATLLATAIVAGGAPTDDTKQEEVIER